MDKLLEDRRLDIGDRGLKQFAHAKTQSREEIKMKQLPPSACLPPFNLPLSTSAILSPISHILSSNSNFRLSTCPLSLDPLSVGQRAPLPKVGHSRTQPTFGNGAHCPTKDQSNLPLSTSAILSPISNIQSPKSYLSPISYLRYPKFAAFTLVELLAVISIVAILLVVGMMGLRGLGGSTRMNAAADEVKLQLDGARQYAKTYNTEVVVGIVGTNAAGMATNDILKVMSTFYPQKDSSGNITNWVATGNPYTLPDGVYFDIQDRRGLATSTASNFFEVANATYLINSNITAVTFRAGAQITNTFIAFDTDGALKGDLYESRVFIPLIPAKRFTAGALQGADLQTNLAAVIEISGQTGQTIIKRVE